MEKEHGTENKCLTHECIVNEWLTTRQTAFMFDQSYYTFSNNRRQGKGPAYYRINGGIRYRKQDVIEYLERCRVDSGEVGP